MIRSDNMFDFEIKSLEVLSSDGIHTLKGVLYVPDTAPKGILHIVHGMTEYIGRYKGIMSAAAQNGYICCGFDNLGHGNTAASDSELGFIAEKDGWRYMIKDVGLFLDEVKSRYPKLDCFLLGHSMGSFIARLFAESYGDSIKKLIICGTGGPNPVSRLGILLTDIMALFKGKRGYSDLVENMAFGHYNKRFEGDTKYEWLTKDRTVIDAYKADRFCTFRFTVSAMHDLICLLTYCNRSAWYKNLRADLPVLLISGEDDPVGDYGKGVKKVYNKLLKQNRTAETELILYPDCRHEILNDTCKEQTIQDIFSFISK